jgi:hypothetical protein
LAENTVFKLGNRNISATLKIARKYESTLQSAHNRPNAPAIKPNIGMSPSTPEYRRVEINGL